ncbi:uncharacterized protein FFFS_09988 [Fusarium fujikuroi]|nr:uncharacterized protein FFFS_09988 [Fusarium fujikuroi]
MFLVGSLH